MSIILDPFSFRHWDDPNYSGAKITSMSKDEFIGHVREFIAAKGGFVESSKEGYVPFCRHVFIPNPTDALVDVVEITSEIEPLIKSGYRARRPDELPVLCRWIPKDLVPGGAKRAEFLDLIFYSREQIILENKDMGDETQPGDWEWGLISIKAQTIDEETPMQPITMMRNALGREYGGSSVAIDPAAYAKSAEYWEKYVSIQ